MKAPTRTLLASGLTLSLALLTAFPSTALAAHFPPLGSSSQVQHLPGKFVWADLFTTNPTASIGFYTSVFGWTAETSIEDGRSRTLFLNSGHPVAGLVTRPRSHSDAPSRWIGYIAVNNLETALRQAVKAGGSLRGPTRVVPDRGQQAIILDPEASVVGLVQSSTGEPEDREPQAGEWNWFQLLQRNPKAGAAFYAEVFGYEVAPDERPGKPDHYFLSSGGQTRAGVGPLPVRVDPQSGWLGIVRVDNLDATLAKALAHGGKLLVKPRDTASGNRFALLVDSTDGVVGVIEYASDKSPSTTP